MAIVNYFKNVLSLQERERETGALKSSQRGGRGRLLGCAALLAALVGLGLVLAACPAAGGGGAGEDPFSYLCTNGTAVEGTTDTAGQSRCAQCDRFYKLNGTAGELGTSCEQIAIGEATRIGNVGRFGVNEGRPFDLAALGDILYMVGAHNDWLYSLNTTDGSATRVGSLTAFGVGETTPTGLAALGNTLYMVGWGTARLYTLNIVPGDGTPDGTATRVGMATQFGISVATPSGLAALGTVLYMMDSDGSALYTLNIVPGDGTPDGTATRIGMATQFGVGENVPTGLVALGNQLYMVGAATDRLYTLDTSDGSATQVGMATQFGVGENIPSGLAALGDILYMVGENTDALYVLRYQ